MGAKCCKQLKRIQRCVICSEASNTLYYEEEESENLNPTFITEENSCATSVTIPSKFTTINDFITRWFSWKDKFLAYMKNIDKTGVNKQLWGTMLLNSMGPVGQKIHSTFLFYDENPQEDIDILIKKFDIYCMYGNRKKRDDENIDVYVNNLIHAATARNYIDPMSIVKEKILQDIKSRGFTGTAVCFIESKGKNLISYLRSLDLIEVIIFWQRCENLMAQEDHEDAWKRSSPCAKSDTIKCVRCGTSHIQSQCPAFGVLCTICNKYNHFSWKCPTTFETIAQNTIKSHSLSRECSIQEETSTRCNKANHLEEPCLSPDDWVIVNHNCE